MWIDMDDIAVYDSELVEPIVENARRYTNMICDIVHEILPTYKTQRVSWLILFLVKVVSLK